MPTNEAPKCQHIKTNGTQCGSPALKDNQFCYYHQHCRPVTFNYRGSYRDYTHSEFHLPVFEDVHSIQLTLRQITELILRHKLDLKEAGLILYALQIASSNLKRMERDQPKPEQVVTDAQIEHPVETPEQRARFKELQDDEIDRIYGCADDSAESSLSGSALSPNVRLTWTNRSRLPGAKMKLAPSWKGFFPSRCWRWPPRLARVRASAFSERKRCNKLADFNSAAW